MNQSSKKEKRDTASLADAMILLSYFSLNQKITILYLENGKGRSKIPPANYDGPVTAIAALAKLRDKGSAFYYFYGVWVLDSTLVLTFVISQKKIEAYEK